MFHIIIIAAIMLVFLVIAIFVSEECPYVLCGIILFLGIALCITLGVLNSKISSIVEKQYLALQEISAQEVIYIDDIDQLMGIISVPYEIDTSKPIFLQFRYNLDEVKSMIFWKGGLPKVATVYNVRE